MRISQAMAINLSLQAVRTTDYRICGCRVDWAMVGKTMIASITHTCGKCSKLKVLQEHGEYCMSFQEGTTNKHDKYEKTEQHLADGRCVTITYTDPVSFDLTKKA